MYEMLEKCVIMTERDTHIYGTVKVGDRGQVVIPVEARKDLNIKPGDLLLVMAGKNRRGIAMVKADAMRRLAGRIIQGLEVTEQEEPEP
jgi:AbrB family looped-hinge helix DNA binding protein